MRRQDVVRLLLLASMWGASFLFMRVSVPEMGPVLTSALRVSIAGIALWLYALAIRSKLELQARWREYLILGAINSAVPFALICLSELRLTAGMAAILNSTSPLFGAMIAAVWHKVLFTFRKGIGILIAMIGVSVLVG